MKQQGLLQHIYNYYYPPNAAPSTGSCTDPQPPAPTLSMQSCCSAMVRLRAICSRTQYRARMQQAQHIRGGSWLPWRWYHRRPGGIYSRCRMDDILEQTGRSTDVIHTDVDLECLSVFEQRLFEKSAQSGSAGNYQWGLDAGLPS